MLFDFVDLEKGLKKIIDRLLQNDFVYSDVNNYEAVREIVNKLYEEKNEALSIVLRMNDEEIVSAISYIFNIFSNNRQIKDNTFKYSF